MYSINKGVKGAFMVSYFDSKFYLCSRSGIFKTDAM